jgi:hypothetical protein
VLIKRNHPERMTSLVLTHTPFGPALSSGPIHTPGRTAGGGAHGKGKTLCVCPQAKCRLRAFLAFPLLVQCCCGCISLAGPLPAEIDRQKLTLGGKEDGVFPGHTHPPPPPHSPNRSAAVRKSFPGWDSVQFSGFIPCGMGLTEENLVGPLCTVVLRISPHYLLSSLLPKLFPKCGHDPFPLCTAGWPREPKVGSDTHVGIFNDGS